MKKKDPESAAFNPPDIDHPPEEPESSAQSELEDRLEDPLERQAYWARQTPTSLERRLWKLLGGKKNPWSLEQQFVLDGFILDFFSSKHLLCIEADGPKHLKSADKDAERDRILLEKHGIQTIRLTRADLNRHTKEQIFGLIEYMISPESRRLESDPPDVPEDGTKKKGE